MGAQQILIASTKRKYYHGSRTGRVSSFERDFAKAHDNIYRKYFADDPIYPESIFRRRYRMPSALLKKIISELQLHDTYFQQKMKCAKKMGASALQKISAAIHVLAYGTAYDAQDNFHELGASTVSQSLQFADGIISLYEKEYLRLPNDEETKEILMQNEESRNARLN
jgi:hypothetical protein